MMILHTRIPARNKKYIQYFLYHRLRGNDLLSMLSINLLIISNYIYQRPGFF